MKNFCTLITGKDSTSRMKPIRNDTLINKLTTVRPSLCPPPTVCDLSLEKNFLLQLAPSALVPGIEPVTTVVVVHQSASSLRELQTRKMRCCPNSIAGNKCSTSVLELLDKLSNRSMDRLFAALTSETSRKYGMHLGTWVTPRLPPVTTAYRPVPRTPSQRSPPTDTRGVSAHVGTPPKSSTWARHHQQSLTAAAAAVTPVWDAILGSLETPLNHFEEKLVTVVKWEKQTNKNELRSRARPNKQLKTMSSSFYFCEDLRWSCEGKLVCSKVFSDADGD